ncbi:AAA family ATPase [Pseudanabaena minima]|uniref:AAA family ATPase n=1 Tax=Pseudanabaena minima TaxID=890415 RepID=UPI003DA80F55
MHIQQVQIKNFRCFENLTVNLNPDINIFVGNNGSGKSAVLDAISAAISPYLYEFQLRLDVNIKDKYIKELNLFQKDVINGEKIDRVVNIIQFSITVTDIPEFTTSYFKEVTDSNNLGSPLHSRIPSELHDYVYQHGEHLKNYWDFPVCAYYRSHRSLIEDLDIQLDFNQDFSPFDALKNSFDAVASFRDLVVWFFVREFQELREGKKQKNIEFEFPDLKQIRKAISIIIAPSARVYFSQVNSSATIMVEWETETGEKIELSLDQLSSGYRNMLVLVMDFARRLALANPQMENPLEAEAVLMIDELDLHLHPTWQQKIIPDLRKVFPNTQIIATTHSPEIVTTVERHQVKILENYQIKECPSPTRGMKSSDIVSSVLGLENLRPDTEESRTLTALFEAIDNSDLEEAKRLRDKLQHWKSFDPDITRADMQIRRLEREITA